MCVRRRFLLTLLLLGCLPFVVSGGRKGEPAPGDAKGSGKRVVRSSNGEEAGGEFLFPEDASGILARLLSPPSRLPVEKPRPRPRPASKGLEAPTLPLPQLAAAPRASLEGPRKPVLPELVTPEAPPDYLAPVGALPDVQPLPAGARLRVPAARPDELAPLPPMAQPLPDKAILADPTFAAARDAVLTAPLPQRRTPAPFLRLTLPDPFEHRDTVRLKNPLGPEPVPAATSTSTPQR